MRVYGLTGGTGCGKSEVARVFESRGVPVVDADRIGHALIGSGGPAEAAVREAFGPGIVEDGVISRQRLGAIVFSDDAALERLNRLVHPHIKKQVARRCADLARAGHPLAVVDAAIIGDDGRLDDGLDGIILVLAPTELRVTRLMSARGLSRVEAERRIDAQVPPECKTGLADYLVVNDGSRAELREKAHRLVEELLNG